MFLLTTAARIALLMASLLAASCGQTGPLTLPEASTQTPPTATELTKPALDPNAA